MNVLLSIKPEFAEKILSGEKTYEFRRTTFRDADAVDTVYLYASSPVQRIVGAFTIGQVIEAPPEDLWQRFGDKSGIASEDRFMRYYEGTKKGYAYEVEQTYTLRDNIDPKVTFDEFVPPTSFYYLDESSVIKLHQHTLPNHPKADVPPISRFPSD